MFQPGIFIYKYLKKYFSCFLIKQTIYVMIYTTFAKLKLGK